MVCGAQHPPHSSLMGGTKTECKQLNLLWAFRSQGIKDANMACQRTETSLQQRRKVPKEL